MTAFPTITADHWRTAIARARGTLNQLTAQIHLAMNTSQSINTRGAGCPAPQSVNKVPQVAVAMGQLEESLALAHATIDHLLKKLDPVLPPPDCGPLSAAPEQPESYGLAGAIERLSKSARGIASKAQDAVDRIHL